MSPLISFENMNVGTDSSFEMDILIIMFDYLFNKVKVLVVINCD